MILCSINIEISKCLIVLSGARLSYVVNITFYVFKSACQKSNRLLIL